MPALSEAEGSLGSTSKLAPRPAWRDSRDGCSHVRLYGCEGWGSDTGLPVFDHQRWLKTTTLVESGHRSPVNRGLFPLPRPQLPA